MQKAHGLKTEIIQSLFSYCCEIMSFFLMHILIAINSPLRTTLANHGHFRMLCFHFHFSLNTLKCLFLILLWPISCSVACYLISIYLWILHFLLVIDLWFHFTVVGEDTWCNFNLLILLAFLVDLSVLKHAPCILEKNVHSVAVGWGVLVIYMSFGSTRSNV